MYYTNSTIFPKRKKFFLLPQLLAPIIGRVLFGCWPLACSADFISCTLFNNDLWPFLWFLQSFLIGTFLSLCCFGVLLPLKRVIFFCSASCMDPLLIQTSFCALYFEKLQVPSQLSIATLPQLISAHTFPPSPNFCCCLRFTTSFQLNSGGGGG